MREINDLLWMKSLILVQTKQNRHLNKKNTSLKNAQI